MYTLLKKVSFVVTTLLLIEAGSASAQAVIGSNNALHPQTEIGLHDARATHKHGGGAALSAVVSINPKGPVPANAPQTFTFTFNNAKTGEPLTRFDDLHAKKLHLIMVSRDLEEFYHAHPDLQPDGSFVLKNFSFPRETVYALFFDFQPTGALNVVLRKELTVGEGIAAHAVLEPTQFPISMDGLTVDLKTNPPAILAGSQIDLTFHFTDTVTGVEITDIRPYLGASAHLVVLTGDAINYLHIHPLGVFPTDPAELAAMRYGPDITLQATFPLAGMYKGWIQVLRDEKITILPFALNVDKGVGLTRPEVQALVRDVQTTEEHRSKLKFVILALLIAGMMTLFYPRKPHPSPEATEDAAKSAPTLPTDTPEQPPPPENSAGMTYDPLE